LHPSCLAYLAEEHAVDLPDERVAHVGRALGGGDSNLEVVVQRIVCKVVVVVLARDAVSGPSLSLEVDEPWYEGGGTV
jgi:hypothetical protein